MDPTIESEEDSEVLGRIHAAFEYADSQGARLSVEYQSTLWIIRVFLGTLCQVTIQDITWSLLTIHIEADWSNKFQYLGHLLGCPFGVRIALKDIERFNMLDKPDPALFEKLLFFSDFGVVCSALSL